MKRRILLVDDDVAVLLTMKAVLEISGFEVETAASAREGKHKLRSREYHMVITDMRMESEASGAEVIAAARSATYHPAVALLTAFPIEEDDWQGMGADKMLVKPMHVRVLLQQIEKLMAVARAEAQDLEHPVTADIGCGEEGGREHGRERCYRRVGLARSRSGQTHARYEVRKEGRLQERYREKERARPRQRLARRHAKQWWSR